MSTILRARGGWWHDYVCPTHGVELDPAVGDIYPCRYGCQFSGEPYTGAWVVMEHQARAREARRLARQSHDDGSEAAHERAVAILTDFAAYYAEVVAGGTSERAEAWMLPGKLFSQALTEAIWSVQIADAVLTLSASPDSRSALGDPVAQMLVSLLDTVAEAWERIVVERDEPDSNYVAWLDAAGGALCRAIRALGHPADDPVADATLWRDRTLAHLHLAVDSDGWEWEGSTYYHLFVLRAYLLSLQGADPSALPAEGLTRLAEMLSVLARLAGPDGALPAMHDGPFDRPGAHLEVLEICVLARQLWAHPPIEQVEQWVRRRLGAEHDGLEDTLGGWFAGPPVLWPSSDDPRGSTHFAGTGYVVLRDPADTFTAILDAGPHGGSHGHLDKLGLYLYGDAAAWQPAPGVPPYGSPLRHGYYARTLAHPTVRVDGADQEPATGTVEIFERHESPVPTASAESPLAPDPASKPPGDRVVATAGDAIAGVRVVRELVMTSDYLLDVVRARTTDGAERSISLGLRPAVPLEVTAAAGGWHTRWVGPQGRHLHGVHRASVAAVLTVEPGRGPSDDPARPLAVGDWSARASDVTFVSAYAPGASAPIADLELVQRDGVVERVRISLANGTTIEQELAR